eukprot:TRINITY_DN3237_c0_g1_i1.p1 TRINITY_DN3237_c0_g1~~TRINITY_DN3237_c0_g1_i1.p1  ORF type:complete len:186 (-),score=59.55 TRINITY_DN3237_c0_g1_i1:76-603(-)
MSDKRLEFEDRSPLYMVDTKPPSSSSSSSSAPRTFQTTKPQRSEALSRARDFLPMLKKANQELQYQDRKDFNIEDIAQDAEQVIEMDLTLGVLEPQRSISKDTMKISSTQKEASPVLRPINLAAGESLLNALDRTLETMDDGELDQVHSSLVQEVSQEEDDEDESSGNSSPVEDV